MLIVLEEVSLIQPPPGQLEVWGAARVIGREAGLLLTYLLEGPFFGGTQLPLLCCLPFLF